jgi:hypothetical protein
MVHFIPCNKSIINKKIVKLFFDNVLHYHGLFEDDALPSPEVNPLEGSPKCSCGKLGLGRRSRLPAL